MDKHRIRRSVPLLAFVFVALQAICAHSASFGIDGPGKELCLTRPEGSNHKEIPRLSIQDLKQLMDAYDQVLVLDVRPRAAYDEGHIKGAISFPWAPGVAEGDVTQLRRDKPMVIYCACGPGEADSADIAAQLKEMGFGNIKILADPSIGGWIKAGYPIEK